MEINEKELKKYELCVSAHEAVLEDPSFAFEILNSLVSGLKEYRLETTKRNSNIWLVVKNLKPEHLEEMKKLIIPEVFTSLGIDV